MHAAHNTVHTHARTHGSAGTDSLRQLYLALLDLGLHTNYTAPADNSTAAVPYYASDVVRDVVNRTNVLPLLPEDRCVRRLHSERVCAHARRGAAALPTCACRAMRTLARAGRAARMRPAQVQQLVQPHLQRRVRGRVLRVRARVRV